MISNKYIKMKPTVILTGALLCVLSPVCFAAEAAPSPAPQKQFPSNTNKTTMTYQ